MVVLCVWWRRTGRNHGRCEVTRHTHEERIMSRRRRTGRTWRSEYRLGTKLSFDSSRRLLLRQRRMKRMRMRDKHIYYTYKLHVHVMLWLCDHARGLCRRIVNNAMIWSKHRTKHRAPHNHHTQHVSSSKTCDIGNRNTMCKHTPWKQDFKLGFALLPYLWQNIKSIMKVICVFFF